MESLLPFLIPLGCGILLEIYMFFVLLQMAKRNEEYERNNSRGYQMDRYYENMEWLGYDHTDIFIGFSKIKSIDELKEINERIEAQRKLRLKPKVHV